MNKIKIETISLKNVLIGKCILEDNELQCVQTKMNKIVSENGAMISDGVITSMLSYEVSGNKKIVEMLIGFILDRPVKDPREFEFFGEYILKNMICYEFNGKLDEIDGVVNNIREIIQQNNSFLKLSGRVYNQIKTWPKNSEIMSCNIYLGIQPN